MSLHAILVGDGGTGNGTGAILADMICGNATQAIGQNNAGISTTYEIPFTVIGRIDDTRLTLDDYVLTAIASGDSPNGVGVTVVTCTGVITFTPTSISGPVGVPIAQALSMFGGLPPYTTAIDPSQPDPPSDVTLTSNTINVAGYTKESGSISIIATDAAGVSSASTAVPIVISYGVAITPTSISGPVGTPISQPLSFTGGAGPYTTVVDPDMPGPPADVTLTGNSVVIGGLVPETGAIWVIATDTNGELSASTQIVIAIS